jgi:hypothetical protein
MLSIMLWRCDCGMSLKATYKPRQPGTIIRCPAGCKTRHVITGEVVDIYRQTAVDQWEPLIVAEWITEGNAERQSS